MLLLLAEKKEGQVMREKEMLPMMKFIWLMYIVRTCTYTFFYMLTIEISVKLCTSMYLLYPNM